jgi:photosystem II stability/assembly factor-like uncharacterized protein
MAVVVGCGDDGVKPDECVMGSCWTVRESGTEDFLYGVDRSDSCFVAVGFSGTVLASADGIAWDPVASGVEKTLLDILWTGDQFIAVGNHAVLSSPDCLSWTERRNIATTDPYELEGVAYSGSILVAVDSRGGQVFTSTDRGESWTRSVGPEGGREFWEITWSGSRFVAVGGVSHSEPASITTMVATSADGLEWSYYDLGIEGELFDVAWTGSQLVAVGGETMPVAGATVVTSPDGETWTERSTGIINPLLAVWSADEVIIAVGYEGAILTSKDGIKWIERQSGTTSTLYGITSSDEKVIVVGTEGTILSSP